MNNEEEVIEILDEFEEQSINTTPITQEDINNLENESTPFNNLGEVPLESEQNDSSVEIKNLDQVKYDPIEPEKQEIKIEEETTEENTKSGLGFVIVLFILLALFVFLLPYISKLF